MRRECVDKCFQCVGDRAIALLDQADTALDACREGVSLSSIYTVLAEAYRAAADPAAIEEHHQGGITGYLAREVIAEPTTALKLHCGMALAFNPSCTGYKVEDTFLMLPVGLDNLTVDPAWPTCEVAGRQRPLWLEQQ